MRILVTNPDSIGDFVLRQPLYEALTSAGHELFLVVRSALVPLVGLVAPGAGVAELASNPYSASFQTSGPDIQEIVEAARRFAPDLICIAPYQRTLFDEFLASAVQPAAIVGMSGILYEGEVGSDAVPHSALRFDHVAAVAEDAPEIDKNQRLCSVLLGREIELQAPRLAALPGHHAAAEAALHRLGLRPGDYWVGCVGHNSYTAVRNWGTANWASVLSHAVARFGRSLLLIGAPDEHAATEEILRQMGESAASCVNLCGASELDLALGLIQNSAGYIGRDTGPMHIAAAMGKPVIAVFGGGTWPRFIPAARTGVTLTVPLPCSPCDWQCHLSDSYCVNGVPVSAVLKAVDEVEAGSIQELSVQQIAPDGFLLARVVREGAAKARTLRRRVAAAECSLRSKTGQYEAVLESLSEVERGAETLSAQLLGAQDAMEKLKLEGAAEVSDLQSRVAESDRSLQAKTEQYQSLLELMHGMSRESEILSAQLLSAQRSLEQVDRECAALRHTLETSLALRLARSLEFALKPVRGAVLALGARVHRVGGRR
jgi:ADP-heptose:LPS heptosyltransferase